MILSRGWRCSLVWGFWGALVVGSAEAQSIGNPVTTTSTATTPDSPQTSAATTSGPSDIPQSSTSTAGATFTPIPFDSTWGIPPNLTIDVPASFSYKLVHESQNVNLTLCKTDAIDQTLPELNQLYIVQSLPECFGYTKLEGQSCSALAQVGYPVEVSYTFEQVSTSAEDLTNFFFCFGNAPTDTNTVVCESYSPYFDITLPSGNTSLDGTQVNARVVARQPETLSGIITLTQTTQVVSISGVPINNPSTTASLVPTSAQVSSTTTASSAASATPTVISSIPTTKSSSHGLSVGAKVGIALGALVLAFLLLLLALFFLRRKHAQRNDGVLPNHHSIHTDSFPHTALMTEKDDASPSSTVIPILNPNQNTSLNQNQHFIHHHPNPNTYTAVPNLSSLSTSPPPTYPSTVPKRKPTANAVASTISRGLSTISRSSGPSNHPSPNIGTASSGNFESYRDAAPTYGDARHSPQVFTSAQALREEGMTAEEVARLEEEERRIDAAIAEAERR